MKELRKVLKTEKMKSDMLITVKWKLIQNSARKTRGNFSNISNKVQICIYKLMHIAQQITAHFINFTLITIMIIIT